MQNIVSSSGGAILFTSRSLRTFGTRMPLKLLKLGQRNRKCSVDSFSSPHLQTGDGQLNDLLKRCSLKSLWPTLRQVKYLIPFGVLESGMSFFFGLVSLVRRFLKQVALRVLKVGSRELYFSKQYGKNERLKQ